MCLRLEVLRLNEVKCADSGDLDHIVGSALSLVKDISCTHFESLAVQPRVVL